MTKTEWLLNVVIPRKEAIAEIEREEIDISDILEQIEKTGVLNVRTTTR